MFCRSSNVLCTHSPRSLNHAALPTPTISHNSLCIHELAQMFRVLLFGELPEPCTLPRARDIVPKPHIWSYGPSLVNLPNYARGWR